MTSHTGSSIRSWLADVKLLTFVFLAFLNWFSSPAQKLIRKVSPFEIGQYDSIGKQKGIWNYFDSPDSLALSINYDNFQLLYINTPSPFNQVNLNNEWVRLPMKRPARYVGSLFNFFKSLEPVLLKTLGNPFFQNKDTIDRVYWLSFNINEQGEVKELQINPPISRESLAIITNAFFYDPKPWLPAIYRNSEVVSRFTIPIGLCYKDCAFEALQHNQITDYGQILFKVGFRKADQFKFSTTVSTFSLRNYDNSISLDWTKDGKNLLYYNRESAKLYRLNFKGDIEELILFDEPNQIQCINSDCSKFLILYSNEFINLNALYNSRFNQVSYPKILNDAYDILAVAETNEIFFSRHHSGKHFLISWEINGNKIDTLTSCHDCILTPVALRNNFLLYKQKKIDGPVNTFTLLNINDKSSKNLPIIDAFFSDWSDDGQFILFLKTDPLTYKSKFYNLNTLSFDVSEVFNTSSLVSGAIYSKSTDAFYFKLNDDLCRLNLSERKSKPEKLISDITWWDISPDRKSLVFIKPNKKERGIYVIQLDQSIQAEFLFNPFKEQSR